MKRISYFPLALLALITVVVACNKVSYKKTKSGLLYQIISNSKDSVVKQGQWLKLHFVQKINDSVLQTSYGKMPVYAQVNDNPTNVYNPAEVFNLLRKGDSVVTVAITDSLLKKGLLQELLPFMKKGDRISTGFRVLEVFRDDATANADREKEMQKDLPRQQKEQEEQRRKMQKEMKDQQENEIAGYEKAGEATKQNQAMETYLAGKGVKAEKVGRGIYIVVKDPGTGAAVVPGKYATVKYTGSSLRTDSTFESAEFTRQIGMAELIHGMDLGLQSFKQGGKGTLYIPGYLAYGQNPNPGSPFKPFEALKFEVEILAVSDTMPRQQRPLPGGPR